MTRVEKIGRSSRQPAFAFEIDLDIPPARRRGLTAGPRVLQSLAQQPVARRPRCERFDRRRGIGAADGRVKRGSDVNRLGHQYLVISPALNRHGSACQRVGVGQEGVRQQ